MASAVLACIGGGSVMTGCELESTVVCQPGEVRYTGRPPPRLFTYDLSCRPDCFSFGGGCEQDCGEVRVERPLGELVSNGRQVHIIDPSSLGVDPYLARASCAAHDDCDLGERCVSGECLLTCPGDLCESGYECAEASGVDVNVCVHAPRALVYAFGFEDLAGGEAPAGWSFISAGPRQYLAGRNDGTAQFVMTASVHPIYGLGSSEPDLDLALGAPVAGLAVAPGRLRIDEVSDTRLVGRFFLGWESETGQPQSQVEGCFNLSIGDAPTAGPQRRLLEP